MLSPDEQQEEVEDRASPMLLLQRSSDRFMEVADVVTPQRRRSGVVKTILCEICLENHDKRSMIGFSGGKGKCKHVFCRRCLGDYLRNRVRDGHVSTNCPRYGDKGCGSVASDADHRDLLSDDKVCHCL